MTSKIPKDKLKFMSHLRASIWSPDRQIIRWFKLGKYWSVWSSVACLKTWSCGEWITIEGKKGSKILNVERDNIRQDWLLGLCLGGKNFCWSLSPCERLRKPKCFHYANLQNEGVKMKARVLSPILVFQSSELSNGATDSSQVRVWLRMPSHGQKQVKITCE